MIHPGDWWGPCIQKEKKNDAWGQMFEGDRKKLN